MGFLCLFPWAHPGLALCALGAPQKLSTASWMNLHSGCQGLLKVCLEFLFLFSDFKRNCSAKHMASQ